MKQQYICQKSYTYARNHISGIVSGICTRSTLFKQRSLPSVSSALDAHLIHTFDCYRSATDLHLQTSDPAIHGAMQIDCQQMARRLVLQILIGFTPSPDLDAKRKDVLEGEEIGTVATLRQACQSHRHEASTHHTVWGCSIVECLCDTPKCMAGCGLLL